MWQLSVGAYISLHFCPVEKCAFVSRGQYGTQGPHERTLSINKNKHGFVSFISIWIVFVIGAINRLSPSRKKQETSIWQPESGSPIIRPTHGGVVSCEKNSPLGEKDPSASFRTCSRHSKIQKYYWRVSWVCQQWLIVPLPFASPTHWPRNIAPLPHISHTSPPLRFVAWCSKNNKRFSFMLFGVFLAILVERKTPLTSTKGIERQKKQQ